MYGMLSIQFCNVVGSLNVAGFIECGIAGFE